MTRYWRSSCPLFARGVQVAHLRAAQLVVHALKSGRVKVRPALERLTERGAVFADGTSDAFDAIVAATGFSSGLPAILDVPGALDEHGEPRGISGNPTPHPGLYFIGFVHSLRGHLFEANRASRRLARHVARFLDANRT